MTSILGHLEEDHKQLQVIYGPKLCSLSCKCLSLCTFRGFILQVDEMFCY